jgi:hypothetical protein
VLQDLIFPLATLLGLADRPGEGHGLGALDPHLCRTLAATAALSPHSAICVTITNADGTAIGHGCAKPGRLPGPAPGRAHYAPRRGDSAPDRAPSADDAHRHRRPPDRASRKAPAAVRPGPAGRAGAARLVARPTQRPRYPRGPPAPPGDPDWCRSWALTLPGGREFTVRIEPVPTYSCDHRNESHAYQPSNKLRQLV